MKRTLLAALMLLAVSPVSALEIDITNHPDKDFMLGYRHSYPGCDVSWWASQWNTEHIMGVGECEGITEERVMADMSSLMDRVKATTNHANFSEYFRRKAELNEKTKREEAAKTTPPHAPAVHFCVYIKGKTYLFSNEPSQNHEGWKIVYLRKSEHSSIEKVATWKSFGENAVADVHGERFMIWDFNKEECATTTLR